MMLIGAPVGIGSNLEHERKSVYPTHGAEKCFDLHEIEVY